MPLFLLENGSKLLIENGGGLALEGGSSVANAILLEGSLTDNILLEGSVTDVILLEVSTPAPTITHISPSNGSTAGGGTLAITGTGFTGATAVKFGLTNATSFVVLDDSDIAAVIPAHAAGAVDVTVTTPSGTSATGPADVYTFTSSSSTHGPFLSQHQRQRWSTDWTWT